MHRNTVSGILLVLLTVSILTSAFSIPLVKANGTIYIWTDGSIVPPTAPIQRNEDTYTLTGDITVDGSANGIEIRRDNIVLDGAGYTVTESANGNLSWQGIMLSGRSHVTLRNMTIENFSFGISILNSSNSNLSGNTVANNWYGIGLDYSSSNSISGNNITNNHFGIFLYDSSNNSISRNSITDNTYRGIKLDGSSNNIIYHNDFIDNTAEVFSFEWANTWDDGYPSGGNYWSDYATRYPSAAEIDNSGLWNTPYFIDANNTDNYPLISPWGSPPTYFVTINAHCNTEGIDVVVPIAEDGSATGYTTPHTFNGLSGSHNFTVPSSDNASHPFLQWSTNQTSATITVSSNGTYTAYYRANLPDLEIYRLVYMYQPPLTQHSGMVNGYVYVRNNGDKSETGNVSVYVNSSVILSQSLVLQPHLNYSLGWTWNTVGYCGQYQISAYVESVKGELELQNNRRGGYYVNVLGKGYCIVVAGNYKGDKLDAINDGCNQVYKILRSVGYSANDVCYMNQQQLGYQDVDRDGINDIDVWSSSANLKWAIETWALSRVTPSQPLTIYIFDHGNADIFSINWPDYVTSADLSSWLDYLQQATGAEINVIYAACHSGSFINELSKNNRVIVTSSSPDENSWFGPSGTWEAFSIPFWNQVKSGHSVLSSFNYAYSAVAPTWWRNFLAWLKVRVPPQTPLLDDNGDGVGHGGSLPASSDGYLANNIYIGSCEWPDPWISQAMSRSYSSWPPSNMTLWAIVKNETNLSHVRAWMLPPDWTPPNSTDTLLSLNLECYEMSEIDHSGNWTVNIPAVNFTNHCSGPGNFTFFITAENENGDEATPSLATVQFTEIGELVQDNVDPSVYIQRPLEGSIVSGTVTLNGTVTDDICLDRVEVYADDTLLGTFTTLPTSTSYFEVSVDTTVLPNGNRTILVKAYDTSGNSGNETITVWVQDSVHDMVVTDVETAKPTMYWGSASDIRVTIANHGSYLENSNVSIYANSTLIATQPLSLSSQNYTALTFGWNTTSFPYGNYTLSAYAWPVPSETNTANNNHTGMVISVTISGDINGDFTVDIYDAITLAGAYNSAPSSLNWNANADINGDNIIDIYDAIILAGNYGKTA
jgi:parallel beta-helix repeat protein